MLRHLELKDPKSCLNKAADDEPVFVLRANDPIAAQTIRFWVAMAQDVHEESKRTEARRMAETFEEWKRTHPKAASTKVA